MFNFLVSMFGWLFIFWNKLPEQAKKEIIELVVSSFTGTFRQFYKNYKNHKKRENE